MSDLYIIAVSRETPARADNVSYITKVEPQNSTFASGKIIRRDEWVSIDKAMRFTRDAAESLIQHWTASPNRATPAFYIIAA